MAHTASYEPATVISEGQAVVGVELGSTRIKATLIGPDHQPLAAGSYGWENKQENGVWTYPLEEAWTGLAGAFSDLAADVKKQYGVELASAAAAGFSGMMHGYLAFDADGNLLVPFRTWRNNITGEASEKLGDLFQFPIPQRWSIAHLYQAILNGEEHVSRIARITTLAGYVHWKLTGEFVLGPNEASGMFPVDPSTLKFDTEKIAQFDALVADKGFSWKLSDILPKIVPAGTQAGTLTEEGARRLDPSGSFKAGIPMSAPEGDAGTGMIATNSVRQRTGNVSAGTSVFVMLVLEESLKRFHSEIDLVLTPDGSPVGMAHSNNCTSDFDAWMGVFGEAAAALGSAVDAGEVFARLMPLALEADADAGGLVTIPYVSGEHVTGFSEGRPLFVRGSDATFNLKNFVRAHLYSAVAAMRTGLDILTKDEGVKVEEIRGHGGFFKTPEVGQRIMAAATNSRCSVMETAGEGGAWGMAILAAYTVWNSGKKALPDYLDDVFADADVKVVEPKAEEVAGFNRYFERYTAVLAAERAAVDGLA
ncbi:MAG: FGGY-family carbohydrate kinase [Alkalispirochaeta sp.]